MASLVKRSGKWLSKPFKCPLTGSKTTKQFSTKELAEAYERACERAIALGLPNLPDVAVVTNGQTIRSLIDATMRSRYGHSAKDTQTAMRYWMDVYARRVGDDSIAADVLTKDAALELLDGYVSKSVSTRNVIRNALNALFAEASERGMITKRVHLRAEKRTDRKDYFLNDEDEALLYRAAPSDEYRDLFRFTLLTGLRLSEAVEVRTEHAQGNVLRVDGKGSKTRRVPLTDEAMRLLEKHQGFWRFNKVNVKAVMTSMKKRHGLPCTFHTLRHTTASRLAMRGASVLVIKELLGHSSLETTQKYMHLAPGALDEVASLLG
mgnify:FL=1